MINITHMENYARGFVTAILSNAFDLVPNIQNAARKPEVCELALVYKPSGFSYGPCICIAISLILCELESG
jgi:hypothetical protein